MRGDEGGGSLRILHVTHTLSPEAGGPTESILRLSEALVRQGHGVEIVTLDGPGAETAETGLTVHALGVAGWARGYAATPKLAPWLQANRTRFDAVLVHGLWQYQGWGARCALRGTGTPWLVFPHGMLDPWFRQAYPWKHYKKALYWRWRENRVVNEAAAVCFTCEEERRVGREVFRPWRARERVVVYGTADPLAGTSAEAPEEGGGRPYLLFLGRIHPKKGLEALIRSYAATRAGLPGEPELVIAGPGGDTAHGRELRELAEGLCPPGTVRWPGMVTGAAKAAMLQGCEAMVLTSFQENFGIAVAEALGCGRPVLISDQVNIWREIAADAAGLVEPVGKAGATRLLTRWGAMTAAERAAMGAAARRCFLTRFEAAVAARSLARVIGEFCPDPG